MAFKIAGSMAIKDGARTASPALREPVMAVEVVAPTEFVGTVVGDLNRRRGRISGTEPRQGGVEVVNASVPLSEMFGDATSVRSATQGPGHFHHAVRELPGGAEVDR